MDDLAIEALDEAQRQGTGYADVRAIQQRTEEIRTRDGELDRAGEERDSGFGVRVLIDGAWGFAAHNRLDRTAIPGVVRAAVDAARAQLPFLLLDV